MVLTMTDPWYVLSGILLAGAITWALRALPFAMLAPIRHSRLLAYLGERMPLGIMLILAVYTVRNVNVTEVSAFVPVLLALTITVALHLWRSNMTLSVLAGTGIYVLMMSLITMNL